MSSSIAGPVVGFVAFFPDGGDIPVIFGFLIGNAFVLSAFDEDHVGALGAFLRDFRLERFELSLQEYFLALDPFSFVDERLGLFGFGQVGDVFDSRFGSDDLGLEALDLSGPFGQLAHELAFFHVLGFGAFGERHLPAVVAGQVASVPLGANVVDVADNGRIDQVRGVIVEDVVVALVPDRKVFLRFVRDADHLLALGDRVTHELFGQDVAAFFHGEDRRGRVQVQGQTDDDAFDPELVDFSEQVAVVFEDLDVLTRLRFRSPAVFLHEAGPDGGGGRAVAVAVERAVLVVRANIGDRDDLNVARVKPADQDAAFVARAEDRDANRLIDDAVFEVVGPDTSAGGEVGATRLFQEFATYQRTPDRGEEVFLTDFYLFGS